MNKIKKQKFLTSIVFVGTIAAAQGAAPEYSNYVRIESKKCADSQYENYNSLHFEHVESLLKSMIDLNNIEIIHDRYIKEGVQMEMEYGGQSGHNGGIN